MDESTQMPISEEVEEVAPDLDEKVREWALDWADKYDQTWDEPRLVALLGKSVSARAETDDGPRGFTNAQVVGYSIDKVCFRPDEESDWEHAVRSSILTADGKQLAVLSGMEISEDE